MVKKVLFFFIFFVYAFNSYSYGLTQNLVFPLRKDIMSAIPLNSDDAKVTFLSQDKNNFYFSIKNNDKINYWSFSKDNLYIKKIKKINKTDEQDHKRKEYQLEDKKGKLVFFYNKKRRWERESPRIQIINYYFNGKILIVLFKNGFLNIFSENGTLEYWKPLDYKSKYIIDTEKGIFIFSETLYYYFDKKKKKIKKGKLNIKLSSTPIIMNNSFYIFGKKKVGNYFVIEKLSSKIGFEIDYDKPVYFKGDKIKIKIKKYNLKKVRISIDLINDNKTINLIKSSKKMSYSLYLSSSGKTTLIFYVKATGGEYRIKLNLNIIDKEKTINNLLSNIYENCHILTGGR